MAIFWELREHRNLFGLLSLAWLAFRLVLHHNFFARFLNRFRQRKRAFFGARWSVPPKPPQGHKASEWNLPTFLCVLEERSANQEHWVAKAKKIVVRREYTNADVKELRAHSKAKTPVAKIAKLTKRTEGSLRQKAIKLGIRLGHRR
jgi:hypothetical protein